MIETTPSGRIICICDVCADKHRDTAWIPKGTIGNQARSKSCTGPIRHKNWNYRAADPIEAEKERRRRKLESDKVYRDRKRLERLRAAQPTPAAPQF